jgi:hypothetical protein
MKHKHITMIAWAFIVLMISVTTHFIFYYKKKCKPGVADSHGCLHEDHIFKVEQAASPHLICCKKL